jgi:hypothetical protein
MVLILLLRYRDAEVYAMFSTIGQKGLGSKL